MEKICSLFDNSNEEMTKETAKAIFSQPIGKIGEVIEKVRKDKILKLLQQRHPDKLRPGFIDSPDLQSRQPEKQKVTRAEIAKLRDSGFNVDSIMAFLKSKGI